MGEKPFCRNSSSNSLASFFESSTIKTYYGFGTKTFLITPSLQTTAKSVPLKFLLFFTFSGKKLVALPFYAIRLILGRGNSRKHSFSLLFYLLRKKIWAFAFL